MFTLVNKYGYPHSVRDGTARLMIWHRHLHSASTNFTTPSKEGGFTPTTQVGRTPSSFFCFNLYQPLVLFLFQLVPASRRVFFFGSLRTECLRPFSGSTCTASRRVFFFRPLRTECLRPFSGSTCTASRRVFCFGPLKTECLRPFSGSTCTASRRVFFFGHLQTGAKFYHPRSPGHAMSKPMLLREKLSHVLLQRFSSVLQQLTRWP